MGAAVHTRSHRKEARSPSIKGAPPSLSVGDLSTDLPRLSMLAQSAVESERGAFTQQGDIQSVLKMIEGKYTPKSMTTSQGLRKQMVENNRSELHNLMGSIQQDLDNAKYEIDERLSAFDKNVKNRASVANQVNESEERTSYLREAHEETDLLTLVSVRFV